MFRITIVLAICTAIVVANKPANKLLTKGVPKFSSDLYQQCSRLTNGNLIISPFSVVKSLELLSQGADGNTYEEIKNALYLNDKGKTQTNFMQYTRFIRKGAREATLSIANRIFIQKGYEINRKFNNLRSNSKLTMIRAVDFANSINAAHTINRFVESKTKEKIKDLIDPSMIDSLTRVVLVNAIYFRANWEHPFEKKHTQRSKFYVSESETIPADFMFIHQEFYYGYNDHLEADTLQLGYANSSYSMVFILPSNITGLPTMESKMKNFNLATITDEMEFGNIEVTIPKFKVQFETSLKNVLKNMGMSEMFSADADFSDFFEDNNVTLSVSDVYHKAFIEVDESGTEAAAATGLLLVDRTLPPSFQADHPFFYYIWDSKSRTAVFIGRVTTIN